MPRTVLIVEDVEQYASTLEIALATIPGVEVALARSGREALDFLVSRDPAELAALLTDLHMPVMDGFELIEQVRADPRYRYLPIVVISGDADPATPDRLLRMGADAYFPKPYSPGAVRRKVEDLVNAH